MPSRTLEAHYEEFLKTFNAGDLEGLAALYHEDAVLIPQPGEAARGIAQVRETLLAFLALKGTMELKLRGTVEGPNTAITYGMWNINAVGEDGAPINLSGESTEVVQKQPDGTWRIVLDDPYSCS